MVESSVDRLVNLSYDHLPISNSPRSKTNTWDTSAVVELNTFKTRHSVSGGRREEQKRGSPE